MNLVDVSSGDPNESNKSPSYKESQKQTQTKDISATSFFHWSNDLIWIEFEGLTITILFCGGFCDRLNLRRFQNSHDEAKQLLKESTLNSQLTMAAVLHVCDTSQSYMSGEKLIKLHAR